MEFKGKTALITGASRGLGFAVADLLARAGANLVIAAREREPLEQARALLAEQTDVVAIAADVSEDAEAIVEAGTRRFGPIDIVVHNASELGPSPMPSLADLPWQALERILRVNVTAPLHLTQLVLPGMIARGGGTIVAISSDAGVNAYPSWGGYGASKAALEHLARTFAVELNDANIRVLVIDPGDMDTQMHRLAEPGVDLSHLAKPEAVAPAIVDLIGDDAVRGGRFEAQALLAKVG
ncbi:MAG TPA: SDR family oxidoreductase [Candidatus Eremiobacteraceae bacterium]|nr:SDR family oxidoreductase [Candidatus Eremiobacteraceae bacterium]